MFSWGGSSNNTTGAPSFSPRPPPPPQEQQSLAPRYSRDDQIQSYIKDPTLGPSTRRVSQDDSTYDTVFQTRGGDALILRVHFPAYSNNRVHAPIMTLVGVNATHPWIDNTMRVVGYSPLSSDKIWSSSNLKLGEAVNAVVRHLQLEPPQVIQVTDPSLQRLQQTLTSKNQTQKVSQNQPDSSASVSDPPPPEYESVNFHIPIPPIPTSFPEIDNLSQRELQNLLDDDDAFHNLLSTMSSVTTVKDLMNSIFKGNLEAATMQLEKEERMQIIHGEVISLQNSLQEKNESFQKLFLENKSILQPNSDNKEIIRALTKKKKEAFEESEKFAQAWIDDQEDSVDDFIKKFLEIRKVHHMRAAKIERLQQIEKENQQQSR